MTTVNGTLLGGGDARRVEMRALLVDVTGLPAVGYVPSREGELVRPVPITPGEDGAWTADLIPNALIESTSGDTLWAVQEGRTLSGQPIVTHVLVPETGEWWVGALRVDLGDAQTGQGSVVYAPGPPGLAGTDGADGASAYKVWLDAGNTGTEADFLDSLRGEPGGPGTAGTDGEDGEDGASAYEVAVAGGFTGTETEWLASLVGPQGEKGDKGEKGEKGEDGSNADAEAYTDAAITAEVTRADAAYEPAGTAAAAVTAHTTATDPHQDRAWADTKFATVTDLGTLNASVTSLGGAVTNLDGFVQDTLTRVAAIEQGTAFLSALNVAGNAQVAGGNLTVTDFEKGYRFRVDGSALDLEATGTDLIVSNWSGNGFNGTQRAYLRLSADAQNIQAAGRLESVAGLYGAAVHALDPTTGVAAVGARNALANVRIGGRLATAGPPTAGAWDAGDTIQDATGTWWLCAAGGEPGTWQTPASPGWSATDQGLAGWTFDPASCTATGTTLSAGFIYLMQIRIRQTGTLSRVHAVFGTGGTGLTAGQCLAGLYDSTGTRVGVTGDQSVAWASAGNKSMPLLEPYAASAGRYYVAFLHNGTTSPSFACGSTHGATFTPGNANLPAGSYRFCRSAAGQTALPASISLAGCTPDANNVWAAAS